MTVPAVDLERRGFRAPGTTFMISGGLLGAVGAYVFQVYGGRVLGAEAFAPVGVLWTLFFILATILLVPAEQYVTREVASGRKVIPHDLGPAAVMVAIGSIIGGGFVLLTLDRLFEGSLQFAFQIVLLMAGYGLLFVGKGVLAGRRRFSDIGWVMVLETVSRLAAGVAAIQLAVTSQSLGWAMVLGGFSAIGMRWWRHDRGDPRPRVAPASRFLSGYLGATSSSQVLLGAAPIAVAALGAGPALVSVIFVTFTLYRAPLTLIFSLQGRILPYLVGLAGGDEAHRLGRIAGVVVVGGSLLALLGGLVGWLVGPEVVGILYGEEFMPSSTVALFVAAGVMAAATAQIAGQVLVAEARTTRLAGAWLGGLVAAVAALAVVRAQPDVRVAIAFAVGEFTALVLMAGLAVRRKP